MNEYPKYKFHKTKDPVIVKDAKEEKALGPGWAESPAFFEKPKAQEEPVEDEPEKKGKK